MVRGVQGYIGVYKDALGCIGGVLGVYTGLYGRVGLYMGFIEV